MKHQGSLPNNVPIISPPVWPGKRDRWGDELPDGRLVTVELRPNGDDERLFAVAVGDHERVLTDEHVRLFAHLCAAGRMARDLRGGWVWLDEAQIVLRSAVREACRHTAPAVAPSHEDDDPAAAAHHDQLAELQKYARGVRWWLVGELLARGLFARELSTRDAQEGAARLRDELTAAVGGDDGVALLAAVSWHWELRAPAELLERELSPSRWLRPWRGIHGRRAAHRRRDAVPPPATPTGTPPTALWEHWGLSELAPTLLATLSRNAQVDEPRLFRSRATAAQVGGRPYAPVPTATDPERTLVLPGAATRTSGPDEATVEHRNLGGERR